MSGFRQQLPSMTALVVFEAAARKASFTRAAAELGITQAAVSRQVQALEAGFGFPLFRRLHRAIELTEPGRALAASMSEALGMVAETVGAITSETATELTLSATVAFSHFWLLPKVSAFRQAAPDVKLRILTQDGNFNLVRDDIDVAIRYGDGKWPDGKAILLFDDEVFPVCSPAYIAARGAPDCVADLARHHLIANDWQDPNWTGWVQWLAAFGQSLRPKSISMSCNFYTDAINAAIRGEGIALGWNRLVESHLLHGQLVRVSIESVRPRSAYYVVIKSDAASKPSVKAFLDWIRMETGAALPSKSR
jgi:DNA-binding transcriptional LysR family regulator